MTQAEADELLAEIVEIRRNLQAARDDVAVIEQALGIIFAARPRLELVGEEYPQT